MLFFGQQKDKYHQHAIHMNVKQGKRMGMDHIQLYKLMIDQLRQSHYFQ